MPPDDAASASAPTPPPPRGIRRRRFTSVLIGVILLAGAGLAAVNVVDPQRRQELQAAAVEPSKPSVTLVRPKVGGALTEVRLPATVEALNAAKLHARAGGYVREWFHDIGESVKKGEILASIDSPDLDQQLIQARADLVRAKADSDLADSTADRWTVLAVKSYVSQQAKDEKVSDAASKQGLLKAAQANVARLEALSNYKNIVAPFDGVVTSRNVDVGDLAGTGAASARALFTVDDISKVRVYLRAPQDLTEGLTPGSKATLSLPQYPGRLFGAELVSTSHSIAEDSRSVLIQLQAENRDEKLWPGAYAEVTLQVPSRPSVLHVPSSSLIFDGRGMQVAVVQSGRVTLTPVRLGRNFGEEVEILSGLQSSSEIVKSPPDTLKDGDEIQVATSHDTSEDPVLQAAK